jgi:asparagine synthase (glutamine-hydrolysing)
MCGVAGLVNLNGDNVSLITLKGMTDAISHRGPDGEGHWIENNVGIGHRRLSIIDLSLDGRQPMISTEHGLVLSYNGELYNFRELRGELERLGVTFRSKTDTEVVMHSLAIWGKHALTRFNGMFSFALFNRREKTLLLARDRYGIKPMYYSLLGKSFSFGSEQKAILSNESFTRELNAPALLEYLTFQNIFTAQTLLKNIHLLPPGHYLELPTNGGTTPSVKSYWDYEFHDTDLSQPYDEAELIEELDRLFVQAVNRQLVGDVEVGAYLSGGIDSGSITAIASSSLPNLKTFTCGFDTSSASGLEMSCDERDKAEAMSALFKTEHYEIVLKAGDMERSLPRVVSHIEEPRVGQSYPNYYAAKLTSKFVKVVLSGSGGDELFAGYPWRYYSESRFYSFDDYIDHYYRYWQRLIPNKRLKQVFTPIWSDVSSVATRDIFKNVFPENFQAPCCPEDFVNCSLYFEAKTFLHGLLVVEDKLSMSHGLENRVPFLDNDLVDFAMRCPVKFKLNNLKTIVGYDENKTGLKKSEYFHNTNDGKRILRKMASRYIPPHIVQSRKQGFSAPDASWFRGESIDLVRRILLNKSSSIYDYLDFNSIAPLINEHLSGHINRRLLIWSLLNVELWMNQIL